MKYRIDPVTRVSLVVGEHVPVADFDDPNLDKDAVFYGQWSLYQTSDLHHLINTVYVQRMTLRIPRSVLRWLTRMTPTCTS